MEVTINEISEVQREAHFSLSDAELQPHFDKAYKKFAPKVELKGFRKGKVPMGMIKKMYGEAIEHDTLNDVANETFRATTTERNIEPIGPPKMTDMDFKRGEHFKFRIEFEVKPTFELKAYKGLAIEKPIHKVSDRELDSEIQRLRRIHATMLGVTLVREDGDHVITADVQELADDGIPLVGKKQKDARFALADETLAPEIRDVMRKAEVGGDYRVRFEESHGDHSHPHHVALSVKKIEKVELPDFDDEFVKKITSEKFSTKNDFVANMRNDLTTYWEQHADRKVQDNIVDAIVKGHDIVVPEALVNLYLDSFVEDVKNRSRDRQLPSNFDEAKFRSENKEYATFQAKWGLLRERIIEKEQLTVSDQEIEQLAESEAAGIGLDKAQLLKYYKSSNAATERLLSNKLITMLKDSATITEKVVDDVA